MNASMPTPDGLSALLPGRVKMLLVSAGDGSDDWAPTAIAGDNAVQFDLHCVVGAPAAIECLRDEPFDAVLAPHRPPLVDAFAFAEGLRAGGGVEPVVIVGSMPPNEADALCFESGADAYACLNHTTVRGLYWTIARAVERSRLLQDNRRLMEADRQRLRQEHDETESLLRQQRALLADIEVLRQQEDGSGNDSPVEPQGPASPLGARLAGNAAQTPLPPELANRYGEILRAYVMMGSGRLGDELAGLVNRLVEAGVGSQRAIALHVEVLEELVGGLGNRSARHVMNRADLMSLEVLGLLADGYRERYHAPQPGRRPPPGFAEAGIDLTRNARAA